MHQNKYRVSVIILNWNNWKDTIECLESVYASDYTNYDVIVVDNASTDNSIDKIEDYCKGNLVVSSKHVKYNKNNKPIKIFKLNENRTNKFNLKLYNKFDSNKRLIIIKNDRNYGFAGGNNKGISFAIYILNSDYILILNNDTIIKPNTIKELIKTAESNKKIGIVGLKILEYDNNKIDSFGGYSDILSYSKPNTTECHPKILSYIPGTCMLIKSDAISKYKLFFDERLFLYHEDVDLCWRFLKCGYSLELTENTLIYHKVSKTVRKFNISGYYYSERNRIVVLFSNFDFSTVLKILPIFLVNEFIRLICLIFTSRFLLKTKIYLDSIRLLTQKASNYCFYEGNLLENLRHGLNKIPEESIINRIIKLYLKLVKFK